MPERLSTSSYIPRWVRREHEARFAYCGQWVRGKRVVDCATGDGSGARVFGGAGASCVVAIDSSFEALAAAGGGGKRVCARAGQLPLPARWADVYISLETIEHLGDIEPYLEEAVRVLREEGVFLCSTPNRNVTNPGTTALDSPFNPFHVREFDVQEFRSTLSSHFSKVRLWGQRRQGRALSRVFDAIARLSPRLAARVRQACKLPRLIFDSARSRGLESLSDDSDYEYLLAVCAGPISAPGVLPL